MEKARFDYCPELEEEKSLIEYLLYMANCGFPLTRTMLKALLPPLRNFLVLINTLMRNLDVEITGHFYSKNDILSLL